MTECRILIVEDEEKIAALLRDYLHQSGFTTHWIANGIDVVDWIAANKPDLVLLDVMLPGKDGLTICRELRAFTNLPIIMLTARVEEIDRLLGLELGADDYVCKPFSAREVVARVKAMLRRGSHLDSVQVPLYRNLQVDQDSFSASFGDQSIELTPIEFRILSLLVSKPGRVFTRDQLIDVMYLDGRVVSDRTVDSHAKNLRKKLIAATNESDWIRSIYGVGYRLD